MTISFVIEIFFVRETERLKMFERKVTTSARRDLSVFCKVTSPKTSEIEEHFKFTGATKNTQDLLIGNLTNRERQANLDWCKPKELSPCFKCKITNSIKEKSQTFSHILSQIALVWSTAMRQVVCNDPKIKLLKFPAQLSGQSIWWAMMQKVLTLPPIS